MKIVNLKFTKKVKFMKTTLFKAIIICSLCLTTTTMTFAQPSPFGSTNFAAVQTTRACSPVSPLDLGRIPYALDWQVTTDIDTITYSLNTHLNATQKSTLNDFYSKYLAIRYNYFAFRRSIGLDQGLSDLSKISDDKWNELCDMTADYAKFCTLFNVYVAILSNGIISIPQNEWGYGRNNETNVANDLNDIYNDFTEKFLPHLDNIINSQIQSQSTW